MKISEAKTLLREVVQYNIQQAAKGKSHNTFVVPFLEGDPGVGKTAAPRQVAEELEISYKQVILAQFDAGELAGLPWMDKYIDDSSGKPIERNRMIRLRPNYLPDLYGADGAAGIFNLDELPQAFLANQNIASQIVNEYRVGEHNIPMTWTMCCTGNKPENKAGTTSMPSHLRDRLLFIPIEADHEEFSAYASQRGIHPHIRAYLHNNPNKLAKFDPGAKACPSPRSWEKTSAILGMDLPSEVRSCAVQGMIGEGAGREFIAWIKVEKDMPKIDDVIRDPDKAPLFGNDKADVLYMLLGALSDRANKDNIAQIMKYIKRLPSQEFSVYFMRDMITRDPTMKGHKAVSDWIIKDGKDLLFL